MLTFLFCLISGSQLLSELAGYVEMKLGQEELLSSEKVCSKVKLKKYREPIVIRCVIHFQYDKVKCLGISNHTINMLHSLVESNFRAVIPSLKNLC